MKVMLLSDRFELVYRRGSFYPDYFHGPGEILRSNLVYRYKALQILCPRSFPLAKSLVFDGHLLLVYASRKLR